MRAATPLLLLLLACSHPATSARTSAAPDLAFIADTIARYDQQIIDADSAGDKAKLGELLSDDFQQLWPSGDTVGKQRILASLRPNPPEMKESLQDVRVQVNDPVAISRGFWLTTGAPSGSQTVPRLLYSNVWLRQGTHWRLVASVLIPQEESE